MRTTTKSEPLDGVRIDQSTWTGVNETQGALSIDGLMYAALAARKIGMHSARPLSNVLEPVYYICRKGYQSVSIAKRRIAMNPVTT